MERKTNVLCSYLWDHSLIANLETAYSVLTKRKKNKSVLLPLTFYQLSTLVSGLQQWFKTVIKTPS